MVDKQIRDNIYGFVNLEEDEVKAIAHPYFQRLRRIKQNGFLDYVYPAAKHDRFQHCLGVNHLMKKVLQHFKDSLDPIDYEAIIGEYEKELKWAALLHDIGHFPLSHTCEKPAKANHEEFGAWLIKETALGDVIPQKLDKDTIANIITGEPFKVVNIITEEQKNETKMKKYPLFVLQLLHSGIDLDRMDYLLRDSGNIGIPYGTIGYEHIIRTFSIFGDEGILCIDEKGIPSVDGMVLARIQMYLTAYTHPVNEAYSQMMREIYDGMECFPKLEQIKEEIERDESFWETFDDDYIRGKLRDVKNRSTPFYSDYADMLLNRKHVLLAHERKEWSKIMKGGDPDTLSFYKYGELLDGIKSGSVECNIPKECILIASSPVKYSDVAPEVSLGAAREMEESLGDYTTEVFVTSKKKKWSTPKLLVVLNDSISHQLGGKQLNIRRAYTLPKYRDQLRNLIEEECKKRNIE